MHVRNKSSVINCHFYLSLSLSLARSLCYTELSCHVHFTNNFRITNTLQLNTYGTIRQILNAIAVSAGIKTKLIFLSSNDSIRFSTILQLESISNSFHTQQHH